MDHNVYGINSTDLGHPRFRFPMKVSNQFTIPSRSQYDAEWFEVGARWSSFDIPGKLSIIKLH